MNNGMTDRELLAKYVAEKDQGAYGELVRRHMDWVYCCAKRLVRDTVLAEDVAQAVFILLARKGAGICRGVRLEGWLLKATQYCARAALRKKQRREKHEREAVMRQALTAGEEGAGANWEEVWPVLDEAVAKLRWGDREAVQLRFYRGLSFAEVARALGTGEEAAKKRVGRALEKLRGKLAAKGVSAGVGALGVVMAEKVTEAAPAGVAKGVIGAAAGTTTAATIAKGAVIMMAWAKVKVAAAIVAAIVFAGAGGTMAAVGSGKVSSAQAGSTVKSYTYRGQVVDRDGRPIGGANIELSAAMKGRSDKWSGRTDDAGRFEWSNRLNEQTLLSVGKDGFRSFQYREVQATGQEQKITLLRSMTVKGRVVDAQTGRPLRSFQAMPAMAWAAGQPLGPERDRSQTFTDGSFDISFPWQYPINAVHVEALGYRPADSRLLTDDEGEVTCDFRLESAQNITGVVVLPDGKPAAGAEIYLPAPQSTLLYLDDPASRLGQRGPSSRPSAGAVSGAAGDFTLPPQQFVGLAAVHPQGFAVVTADDLARSGRVVLQGWGSIQGEISPALRAGIGQKAVYSSQRTEMNGLQVMYKVEGTVDAQGRFAINRVPPGHGVVSRALSLKREMTQMDFSDHGVMVTIAPGQQSDVKVGGQGVEVTGRVQVPPGSDWRVSDSFAYVDLRRVNEPIKPPAPPADFANMNMEQKKAWYEKWLKTPEGQAFQKEYNADRQRGQVGYTNGVRGDGIFQVLQVPPGRYRLTAKALQLNFGPAWGPGKPLGAIEQEVVVPPDSVDGQKMDLGQLVLKSPPAVARKGSMDR